MSALITAVVVTAVGAGVSAYSSYQSGQASKALGNYNATVGQLAGDANADRILQTADYNAAIDDQNASDALKEGATGANNDRFNSRRVLASQRARMAAGGVVGESGSPLKVAMAQAGFAQMSALNIERQGQNTARQSMQSAATTRWEATNQAAMTRWSAGRAAVSDVMQGNAAARAGTLNAGATLLQGAGKAASMYAGSGG